MAGKKTRNKLNKVIQNIKENEEGEEVPEGMVLVGFGKHDLDEILSWFGTPREIEALKAPTIWPPRWRRESACSEYEQTRFVEYTETVRNVRYTDFVAL